MFTGYVGRPDTIEGGEEPKVDKWERHPLSESSAYEEGGEEENVQYFLVDESR